MEQSQHSADNSGSHAAKPSALLFTSQGSAVQLQGMYRSRSAFLLAGGPSLTSNDLSLLAARGILTCALNNAAAVYRPHLWISVDSAGNFVDSIWRDPGIMKFIPAHRFQDKLVARNDTESLYVCDDRVENMPAVFGFHLNAEFRPEAWLYEDTVNFGNEAHIFDADGNSGGRSVMYVALRLLFYLGVRRLYLLGCDFHMTPHKPNYSFPQDRTRASVFNNNNTYRIFNHRMRLLKPYFQAEQFEILNCTEGSHLTAFPFVSFASAIQDATRNIPQNPVTDGMYDRVQRNRARPKLLGDEPSIAQLCS